MAEVGAARDRAAGIVGESRPDDGAIPRSASDRERRCERIVTAVRAVWGPALPGEARARAQGA